MRTQRIRKRYPHVVCIVLTLFLVIGLFGSDAFAATHYSLLNQPSTTIATPPIILQSGSVGNSTIYANNTSAKVNVTAPENQYVTQQSNIDGIADVGTHSNFTAQQYGPDNINDTLTESDVPIVSGNTQYVQSNSSNHDNNIGGTSNFPTEQSTDNTYDTLTEANTNATACIPITLNNTRSSATPNPFQEKISWNPSSYTSYEASDLGNIRFYSDNALTTPLYAWLESCTSSLSNTATNATAWVKLTNPIAANGGTLTIYMAFLSTSTGFDGNYWGDSPNLSSTYGQNDNGAKVFNFYDNFAGTTLSTKWTAILGSSGASITVNNGLTVTTTSSAATAYGFVISQNQPYPAVAETYTSSGNSMLGVSTSQSLNGFIAPYSGYSMDWYSGTDDIEYEGSSYAQLAHPTQASFPVGIWQVVWSATGSEYFQDGAGVSYTGTNNGATIANYGIYVGQSNGVVGSSQFRWARMRAYPPSNVMPSASFGSVTFPIPNYKLDLERQWTTASYNANASKLLCIKTGAFSDSEALEVDVWNGAWTVLNTSLAANSWNNMSVTTYLTSASFAIRFIDATTAGDPTQSTWQIDSVLLYTSNSTDNYQLDIEEQWTNANTTATNEELDIYMGAFSTPATILSVQWYNTTSSSWLTIISSLNASTWNNVTVVNYLTSSTFTIQFVNTTSGTTQSWWKIDCALLHLWTNSTYDYVLNAVNQVTNAWNVSLQVYGSSNIARLSSATISFHDGTSSNQIVVNGGSIVQSQGALYNLLGGSGTTIHVSISNLLANATGASYLYVYLEILTPNTSTYLLYAITLAIT